ncbi:MAG: hypothetical protein ACRC33_22005 [Gemmataceae bacterium]
MTAAILWKEYREQRAVWAAFALVAAGFVFLLAPLMADEEARQFVAVAALVLCWTYGVLSGSMLLAGEREDRTLRFLDTLPGDRRGLWRAKALAGALFTLALAACAAAAVAGSGRTFPEWPALWIALIPACAASGLAWGLCGGARGDTVLGSVGRVLFAVLVLAPLTYAFFFFTVGLIEAAFFGRTSSVVPAVPTGLLFLLAPLPVSFLRFTALDRQRRPGGKVEREPSATGMLFGLAWRRLGPLLLVTVVAAVPAGMLVLQGGRTASHFDGWVRLVAGPGLWVGLSGAAGVLIGGRLFADEQAGARRFLADQRFPLGPVWWSRVLTGFVGLTAVWLALLLPTLIAAASAEPAAGQQMIAGFGTRFLGTTAPVAVYLLLWPATGFACGTLAGMVFRKPVVAGFVGLLATFALTAVWLPSLVTGGLTLWQALTPAVALLALSRALMQPWAADALTGGHGLRRLVLGVAVVAALVLGGLGWRVAAAPRTAEPAGLAAFLARLPAAGENEAGELTRRACELVNDQLRAFYEAPEEGEPLYFNLLGEAVTTGWPASPALEAWMDERMKGEWPGLLAEAAAKPPGVVFDPRRLTYGQPVPAANGAHLASLLLAGDALRRKQDDATFVVHLERALAMARNLGGHGPEVGFHAARSAETVQWAALDVWLSRLSGKPELLRRVWDVLARHRVPADDEVERLGGYTIACNSLDHPQEYFRHGDSRPAAEELALLAGAVRVPWERARQLALLRAAYFDPARLPPDSQVRAIVPMPWAERGSPRRRLLAFEAARLRVALRLYEAEHGKPAARLEDLPTPVPDDPFGGGKLRYRVEDGQGVIWSVGEDGADDGAARPNQVWQKVAVQGEDIVFRVPRPRR